ncbi:hypothetical protein SKAU_G00267580 [Synaphobranchus kaupii]|uniref:Solute carrier family 25 member 45 n=1 Tax=Synaphobranchus kaupii TaxID=118154 RepID=A0A9Q1EZX9_SYNKA|nr:hypothetical protein SKAU_G00267580 [Synaphobranchus kaupii]
MGLVVGHPMDTVKVRLQTQTRYKGIIDCVTRMYAHEGIPGFFKGMSFPVLSIAFSKSLVFGSYSNALDYLTQSQNAQRSRDNSATAGAVFMAGCFSGAIQVLVTAPTDLVKEDGARGLFRGMGALALRDVPCYGLYFLPYDLICKALTESGKQPDTFAVIMAGGIAGVVTWACATPMDVVKTRLQMSGAGGPVYRGVLHCISLSLRQEGVQVFFKGLLLNSIRAFPVNAITFLCYERLMSAMTSLR